MNKIESTDMTKEEFKKTFGHEFGEKPEEIILNGSDKDFGPPNPDDVIFFPDFLEMFRRLGYVVKKDENGGFYRIYYKDLPNFEMNEEQAKHYKEVSAGALLFDNIHECTYYKNLIKCALEKGNKIGNYL